MDCLEEKLREAACVGDRETVEKLLSQDININSRHNINGWTALHWACKRGHEDIARILLKQGADPSILTNKNETAAYLCSNPSILDILGTGDNLSSGITNLNNSEYIPHYIRIPTEAETTRPRFKHPNINNMPTTMLPSVQNDDIVLKIRVSGSSDPDFIEVDIPKWKLTYKNLLKLCCEELQCSEDQVERIRKLPNTRLRNDNDVHRLEHYQALELVMKGPPGTERPTNCYQSISTCKDQTILY
ncbi:hypothetical protein WA026_001278 [Henosepilachna vigintioctopunctata]|uniref:Ankyrin repeat domain-containing protein 40 n=1 Tax=Henosepilachna vigintioctopunctata TaxID=420089 RepID=A0AAW1UHG0_9CUCU